MTCIFFSKKKVHHFTSRCHSRDLFFLMVRISVWWRQQKRALWEGLLEENKKRRKRFVTWIRVCKNKETTGCSRRTAWDNRDTTARLFVCLFTNRAARALCNEGLKQKKRVMTTASVYLLCMHNEDQKYWVRRLRLWHTAGCALLKWQLSYHPFPLWDLS